MQKFTVQDIIEALSGATDAAREALPGGRDRIVRALGGKAPSDDFMMSSFGIFAAGIVLGAGLAVLFAPKPGSEIREAIGEKISNLRPTGSENRGENLRPAADA
jgi:hypothetical protein